MRTITESGWMTEDNPAVLRDYLTQALARIADLEQQVGDLVVELQEARGKKPAATSEGPEERSRIGIRGKPHWLTPEIEARLGKESDKAIEADAGVGYQTIRRERMRLGIPSFGEAPIPTEWTPEQIALLGTVPDSKIAEALGVKPGTVATKRKKLGILPFSPPSESFRDRLLRFIRKAEGSGTRPVDVSRQFSVIDPNERAEEIEFLVASGEVVRTSAPSANNRPRILLYTPEFAPQS